MLTNVPKFTYIIGYRHSTERMINLRRVLEWLSGFSSIDILIVEQDTHSKISYLGLKARHVFIKSSEPYNRSWAFNVGIKMSNTNIIIFGDSDLIMNPNHLIESIKEIDNYDVVSPYKSVIDLDPSESTRDLNGILSINRPGRGETDNQKINLCGGIVIFKRESILKIGGWSELFIEWGGEDDFQTIKVNMLGLSSKEMPYRCYHLYHTRVTPTANLYQRNLQLLNQLASMKKEDLVNHINMEFPKIGLLNKHA